MSLFRGNPNEVFTPRSRGVNDDMYIERTQLQERLQRAVNGSQHIIVYGDSGCGKTWLYQRYLGLQKIQFKVIDMSLAAEWGLDHAFRDSLTEGYGWVRTGKNDSTEIGGKAVVEAHKRVEEQYAFHDVPPFEKLITELSGGNNKTKFLVFDNLEQISQNREILKAISRLMIRLDNPRFSLSGVRFLLVGVVSDLKNLIAHHDKADTVANRLTEIPEVCNLSYSETSELVRRGFKKLRADVEDANWLVNIVWHMTFGNPQQVHALCYQVACEAEKNDWKVGKDQIHYGFECWVGESLNQHKSMVEARLNKKETKVQRRNQVLHVIATSGHSDFSASEVEQLIRHEFPESVRGASLGCYQILQSLCEGPNPILAHVPSNGNFRFTHPKVRLAIRALLCKSEDGDIIKLKDISGLRISAQE